MIFRNILLLTYSFLYNMKSLLFMNLIQVGTTQK